MPFNTDFFENPYQPPGQTELMTERLIGPLSKKGNIPTPTHSYNIQFTLPQAQTNNLNQILSYSCESISLPGRGLSTQPNRLQGPIREMPYENLYSGDITATFRVSQNFVERKFFEAWMDLILPTNSTFRYMNEYSCDLGIQVIGRSEEPLFTVSATRVYPKNIQVVELSSESTNNYMRMTVDFAFQDYQINVVSTEGFYENDNPFSLDSFFSSFSSVLDL